MSINSSRLPSLAAAQQQEWIGNVIQRSDNQVKIQQLQTQIEKLKSAKSAKQRQLRNELSKCNEKCERLQQQLAGRTEECKSQQQQLADTILAHQNLQQKYFRISSAWSQLVQQMNGQSASSSTDDRSRIDTPSPPIKREREDDHEENPSVRKRARLTPKPPADPISPLPPILLDPSSLGRQISHASGSSV